MAGHTLVLAVRIPCQHEVGMEDGGGVTSVLLLLRGRERERDLSQDHSFGLSKQLPAVATHHEGHGLLQVGPHDGGWVL